MKVLLPAIWEKTVVAIVAVIVIVVVVVVVIVVVVVVVIVVVVAIIVVVVVVIVIEFAFETSLARHPGNNPTPATTGIQSPKASRNPSMTQRLNENPFLGTARACR
ncbi:hypothetical protein [Desulfatirhabdium butyrativorans]|uniref:hypothetical protein n=1 Tax=Desulfatirhabdium butyrativorans TaxID=340467 RepID=UPI000559757D|nr:hypothetical protein [Desulfatirhabdium butyrativorans]